MADFSENSTCYLPGRFRCHRNLYGFVINFEYIQPAGFCGKIVSSPKKEDLGYNPLAFDKSLLQTTGALKSDVLNCLIHVCFFFGIATEVSNIAFD